MHKRALLLASLLFVVGSSLAFAAGMLLTVPASVAFAAGPATLTITTSAAAGTILSDSDGRTLYLWARDERNKSNCTGTCAQTWPPLLTEGAPIAQGGAVAELLGTIARADGGTQVTYNGWPLYRFSRDQNAGDVLGQNVAGAWFVVSVYGGPRLTTAPVKATTSADFGAILTDANGRTLYLYTRDEPNKSNCTGRCAQTWPPLLTIGRPQAGGGAAGELLGFITREEGSTQVTYNGRPLYYYAPDEKPGDTKGQNVGGVWFVLSADGKAVGLAPAALPFTGDDLTGSVMGLGAVLGVLLLAGGLWMRRRVTA